MESDIERLRRSVQFNCDISDARHGADYTLCIYLMKMREYFRWERELPFTTALPREAVSEWLSEREALWRRLESAEFEPLPWAGELFDPFDADRLNRELAPRGWVYSGGLGQRGRPHFFLAELERTERPGGCEVLVSGRELARDLASPPAMTRGDTVFLRRESLRRLLWEKLENWGWSRPDNAAGRAFACYDFEHDLEGSLQRMVDAELDNVLLHERGEYAAGQRLGPQWEPMLLDLVGTAAEHIARAVRDHLADCLVTLPALAATRSAPSIHFYTGNLTALRRELFPELIDAYERWRDSGDTTPLAELARSGEARWEAVGRELIALWLKDPRVAAVRIHERMRGVAR